MSIRWMAVQYVGDILRIPVANESDMDMPFGSSALERDVRRIVVNPFSDSPQMFVPEAENAKLREQIHLLKKGDILHVLTDQELAEQQRHEREMQASITALDDENAELRELAWALADCRNTTCDDCVRWDHPNGGCSLDGVLREFGIEVGDA